MSAEQQEGPSISALLPWMLMAVIVGTCVLGGVLVKPGLVPAPTLSASSYPHRLGKSELRAAIAHPSEYVTDIGEESVPLARRSFLNEGGSSVEGLVPRHTEGLRLFEKTRFCWNLEAPYAGKIPIYVVARGIPAHRKYPCIAVKTDGVFQDAFYCTSSEWGLYGTEIDVPKGPVYLELAFINDGFFYPEDRDLDIKAVSIGIAPSNAWALVRNRAPGSLIPTQMSRLVCGENLRDGCLLWNNGSLGDDVYFEKAGSHTVCIVARPGRANIGHSSLLELRIGNGPVTVLTLPGSTTTVLKAECSVPVQGFYSLVLKHATPDDRFSRSAEVLISGIWIDAVPPPVIDPRPSLDRDTVVIKARDFDIRSTGNSAGDEWVLWENGYLRHVIRRREPGPVDISVRARGEACRGVFPRLKVMLDRSVIASFDVDGTAGLDRTCSAEFSSEPHQLTLVFDNDESIPGEGDRNLYIEQVSLTPRSACPEPVERADPAHLSPPL